jgi:hypothetical protein
LTLFIITTLVRAGAQCGTRAFSILVRAVDSGRDTRG